MKRELRDVDGLLILDKPSGPTSNRCLQQVKHLLRAAKAGHTGALDPLASGVLPLCFGEATKVSQFLLDSDKAYRARIRLGITTATGDSEGEVLATAAVPPLTGAQIEAVLAEFRGLITQQPSIYSALKQNGVPLYQLAREGKEITPKFRDVTIHALQLLAHDGDEFDIEVSCSKGTYVRTLAEDIGKALGTGAHLTALRRLKAGPFSLAESMTIEQLAQLAGNGELDAKLIPPDRAIADLPDVRLDADQARRIRQGQLVRLGEGLATPDVRVYFGQEFVGIGELRGDGTLAAKRLMKY
ncbi:MAG TPA: tRNA pseudouridine(55) synthase TruB [Pseudomonadales bacterium]